jgi:hypothetical protein
VDWAVENAMKINPGKSKAVRFVRARVKDLNYIFGDQRISEASSCKCLGINLSSYLIWADQVNYTTQKAWKVLEFIIRVLKHGNSKEKFSLHVTSASDS